MKEYYYSDGKEKFGPVSIEELIELDLQPDSLIWFAGLDKWRLAKNVKELNFKFNDNSTAEKIEIITKNDKAYILKEELDMQTKVAL